MLRAAASSRPGDSREGGRAELTRVVDGQIHRDPGRAFSFAAFAPPPRVAPS